ncbi:MAG: ABC transporter substrate-binding protein [Caldicoprobacterales bacterium]|nr:ABC transporter substrate-binding protein [Clostridiales bacterium]
MYIVFKSRKFNNHYGSRNLRTAAKVFSVLLIVSLLAQVLTGCITQSDSMADDESKVDIVSDSDDVTNVGDEYYYSFTDSLGNTVNLNEKPQRVVSLVGSYAETWILAGGELVGVTDDVISQRNMDLPPETKIVGTIKDPNLEEVIALSPDFVLLSPDVENHVKISETLEKSDICHAFFKVEHFEEYLDMLKVCTDMTGNQELYEKNGLAVEEQIEEVLSRTQNQNNPKILFIRAFSSGAKAKDDDNFACRILDELGTENIASKHETLLEDLSIEEIILEDPDYIFVVTMGDSEKAIQALKDGIEKNPAWKDLSAVKNDRYIVLPKELFHYKPNARWGESYEYIAKILFPGEFE